MEISDLICIGKLRLNKKVGDDKQIILKLKTDYQKFLSRLCDVFLIYKDHRVRFGKIAIIKVIREGVVEVDFEDIDLKEELEIEDSASVYLDEDMINQFDDENIYFDPVGMKVIWENEEVAHIVNFFFNGAHDVYEIEMLEKKIVLIPDVESFVIETNIEERFIRVVDLDQFF